MRTTFRQFLPPLAALVLLGAACAPAAQSTATVGQPTATPSPATPSPAAPTPTSVSTPSIQPTPPTLIKMGEAMWEDKVRLTLWLDHDKVPAGQPVRVRVTVENISQTPVTYTMWSIGDPPVYTRLEHPYQEVWGSVPLRSPGDRDIVLPAVTTSTLQAGQTVLRDMAWDGNLMANGQSVVAPNGTYTVTAAFYPGDQAAAPQQSALTVKHDVQVTGGATLVAPQAAMDAARAHPQVAGWWTAHTGAAIARVNNGKYEINMDGQWVPTVEEEYRRVLAEQKPEVGTAYENGDWVLTFASKFGARPYQLKVWVDGPTGKVDKVETGGK